jgi:WD40 repeat protein
MKDLSFLSLIFISVLSACSPRTTPPSATAPFILPPRASQTPTRPTATLDVPSIVLSASTERVTLLAWSPDGSLLASAASGPDDLAIRFWTPSGQPAHSLAGHTASVLSLAWRPDGKLLASGSTDQTVRLWNLDRSSARVIKIGKGRVLALAWSPDGSILASGSIESYLNPTVQLWKPDGTLITTMTTKYSGGKFYNLIWSPDGQRLLGGATDYAVWESNGTQIGYLPGCAQCTPVWGAAWAPDSSMFAIGDENGSLYIYNRDGIPLIDRQSSFDINSIAWSPDGKLLAAGRDIWTAEGSNLTSINGQVNSVAWSSEGDYLAVAADRLITLVRKDGSTVAVLSSHADLVNRVAWSPQSLILASASDDKTIRLWRLPAMP